MTYESRGDHDLPGPSAEKESDWEDVHIGTESIEGRKSGSEEACVMPEPIRNEDLIVVGEDSIIYVGSAQPPDEEASAPCAIPEPRRRELTAGGVPCAIPEPRRRELTAGGVQMYMPVELSDYLDELEVWARGNRKEAVRDNIAFWALKVPAILASASAGVWAHFGLTTVSVLAGAIASVCVIMDGIHPRGMLRNTHLRAYHDIRILSNSIMSAWRSRSAFAKEDNVARRLIRDNEAERQRIARAIRDAETALHFENKSD
jgi:hypothetical protein